MLNEGARLIVSGVSLGLVLAFAIGRVFRGLLSGVQPTDLLTPGGGHE